jgi:Zn ribbon nucleic-acid-binding protein
VIKKIRFTGPEQCPCCYNKDFLLEEVLSWNELKCLKCGYETTLHSSLPIGYIDLPKDTHKSPFKKFKVVQRTAKVPRRVGGHGGGSSNLEGMGSLSIKAEGSPITFDEAPNYTINGIQAFNMFREIGFVSTSWPY